MWLILDRPGLRLDHEWAALSVREPRMPGSVRLSAASGLRPMDPPRQERLFRPGPLPAGNPGIDRPGGGRAK